MKLMASTPEDVELFHEKTSYTPTRNFRGIKAVEGDKILGMVGFDCWTPNSAQMHVFWDDVRVMQKLVPEAFRYLFLSGKGIAFAITPAHNEPSLKLQKFLGFKEVQRFTDGWAIGDDLVVTELRKQDCIWVRSDLGKRCPSTA